ncbi:MAG: hypothetical protein GAK41_01018 [Burkholderia gladioli]|nr:MAG: hypothetical protein GAK41_01018 [Burkholderia gladioli]
MNFKKALLMAAALATFAGGAVAQETGALKKIASLEFRVGGFFRVKGGRSPAQRTLDPEKSTSPSGGEDFPALGRG